MQNIMKCIKVDKIFLIVREKEKNGFLLSEKL